MYSDIANESFHYTAQIKGSLQQVKEDTFAAKTKQLQLHSDSVNIKLWVVKTKLNVSFTQTFMQACFCTSKQLKILQLPQGYWSMQPGKANG